MPTLKDHRACQSSDIIEKCLASDQHLAKQGILVIAPLQHRMEKKRQQVEAEQKCRQVFLTVTKAMLDMIALGFEHMVVFVFDLPARVRLSKGGNSGSDITIR